MAIIGSLASGGMKPTTPTIGTASDGGTGTSASVAFTASSYIGKGTITYTATSSPGSFTGTGSSSPITVSGLTTGTAYTFTVSGTTNYGVASASSAASNSVTPANPASYESIASAVGNSSAATITFSSIPSTFKHLQLRMTLKNNDTTGSAGPIWIRFNGDTGSNYAWHYLVGDGGSVSAAGQSSTTSFVSQSGLRPDSYVGSGFENMVGVAILDIHDYASTTKYKTARMFAGLDTNAIGAASIGIDSGLWMSTSAIDSISIITASSNNKWTSLAQFSLYGIK